MQEVMLSKMLQSTIPHNLDPRFTWTKQLPEEFLSSFFNITLELKSHRTTSSLIFKIIREHYQNVQQAIVPKYLKGYV